MGANFEMLNFFARGWEGGHSLEFLVRVCCLVFPILTLFHSKNVIFHTCFQTWSLKSIPVFRPGLRVQIKKFFKCISNLHISHSFLFIWNKFETINTFICSHSSQSKTKPVYRPKWTKCIPVFRPKRHKNHTLWVAHTYIAYLREYPPGIFG